MPKQTFFNLPTEKQGILIDSVKKEFSRVPLNEASVSNIVKNAYIPRGSFYQYFSDKEDAFYYLLELKTKAHHNDFLNTLKTNKGDLFATFITSYRNILMTFEQKENRSFFKNVFLNLNYKMESTLTKGFVLSKDTIDQQIIDLKKHVNMDEINIPNDEKLIHVMQIMVAVTFQNLINQFAKKHTFKEALQHYTFEINLLKKGLYKD